MDACSRGLHSLLLFISTCFSSSPTLSDPRAPTSSRRSQGRSGAKRSGEVTEGAAPQSPRLALSIPAMPFKGASTAATGREAATPSEHSGLRSRTPSVQSTRLKPRAEGGETRQAPPRLLSRPSAAPQPPLGQAAISTVQPIKSFVADDVPPPALSGQSRAPSLRRLLLRSLRSRLLRLS